MPSSLDLPMFRSCGGVSLSGVAYQTGSYATDCSRFIAGDHATTMRDQPLDHLQIRESYRHLHEHPNSCWGQRNRDRVPPDTETRPARRKTVLCVKARLNTRHRSLLPAAMPRLPRSDSYHRMPPCSLIHSRRRITAGATWQAIGSGHEVEDTGDRTGLQGSTWPVEGAR